MLTGFSVELGRPATEYGSWHCLRLKFDRTTAGTERTQIQLANPKFGYFQADSIGITAERGPSNEGDCPELPEESVLVDEE